MSTLIQKAAKGQRKAMEQLYEAAKQKTYFIASSLLHRNSDAEAACVWAFRNIWYELESGKIETEEDFTDLAVRRTVRYCKKQVLHKNPKAYNTPFNRNFLMTNNPSVSKKSADAAEVILAQFTPLQRLIFVLDTAASYDVDRIAKITDLNPKTVEIALTAQISNVERIIHLMEKEETLTYEAAVTAYTRKEAATVIPDTVETQILDMIDKICAPIEQKTKRKKIALSAVAAVALCAVVAVAAVSLPEAFTYTTAGNETTAADLAETEENEADLDEVTEDTEDPDEAADDTTAAAAVTGDGADLGTAVATHYAVIDIEDYGAITLELYGNTAPETVENFVSLAESGFYDGLTIHRIAEGFVIQGGDPNADGTGGSDMTISGEFSSNGFENNLSHIRGVISMARSSAYDSASSQFFIVHEDCPDSLDGDYAAFGYVIEGMEVVDAICEAAEPLDSIGNIAADAQPVISSVTITYAQ